MLYNLLQSGCVDCEGLFKLLDLVEQGLGHVDHGSYDGISDPPLFTITTKKNTHPCGMAACEEREPSCLLFSDCLSSQWCRFNGKMEEKKCIEEKRRMKRKKWWGERWLGKVVNLTS